MEDGEQLATIALIESGWARASGCDEGCGDARSLITWAGREFDGLQYFGVIFQASRLQETCAEDDARLARTRQGERKREEGFSMTALVGVGVERAIRQGGMEECNAREDAAEA